MQKKHPSILVETFGEREDFGLQKWFGGDVVVRDEHMLLAEFRDTKTKSPWNGLLVATHYEHHQSLQKDLIFLKQHPMLKKWLYLPFPAGKLSAPEKISQHKKQIKKLIQLIEKHDPRIGIRRGEKHRKRLVRGDQIPIEQARNLGPKSAQRLRQINIHSLHDLKTLGWEECLSRLFDWESSFCNLNMARALIGAIENQDWRELSTNQVRQAKKHIQAIKSLS